jgi:hypothetical protein
VRDRVDAFETYYIPTEGMAKFLGWAEYMGSVFVVRKFNIHGGGTRLVRSHDEAFYKVSQRRRSFRPLAPMSDCI